MVQYINKDALIAEIERLKNTSLEYGYNTMQKVLADSGKDISLRQLQNFLDTLEVKTDKDNSLEKFKSLQHISGNLHQTLEDWGYAPNLYFFDGMWHVSWISCSEGDGIKDFEGNTPEEAIDKAYNWFHSTFCNN